MVGERMAAEKEAASSLQGVLAEVVGELMAAEKEADTAAAADAAAAVLAPLAETTE